MRWRRRTIEQEERAAEDGAIRRVDDASFLEVTASGRPTIVDFYANWCGPCRRFAPVFTDAARRHSAAVDFGVCDVDSSPRTAALLGITSVPTVVVFDGAGNELGRMVGPPPPKVLEQVIGDVLSRH